MFEIFFDMTEDAILAELKAKYADDEEALETIARAEIDLEYMNSDRYKGTQTPKQHLLELAGFLETWH